MDTKWSDNLLTGHSEIDLQHREMFRQAETFLESGSQGKSIEQLNEMLSFFEDYIKEHFTMEEELQQKHGYPDYQPHKLLHDNYRRRYHELKSQYNSSRAKYDLAIKTILFTIEWLTDHISRADKAVASHINNANLKKANREVSEPK